MSRLLLLGCGPGGGGAAGALDGIASLKAAWSLSRNLVGSFSGAKYTDAGGGAISHLLDQAGVLGVGYLYDGAAASKRPTLSTGGPNSVACADFDGSSDYLSGDVISNFIGNASGAMVISVIIDAYIINNATASANDLVFGVFQLHGGINARNTGGGTIVGYNVDSGGADVPTGHTLATGTPAVLSWRHDAGTLYLGLNGTENSVASGNTTPMTGGLVMGGRAAQYANMKVFEAFTTSDGSQTAAISAAIANMMTHIGA